MQREPGASFVPVQLSACVAKSPESFPAMLALAIDRSASPLFSTVIVWLALVASTWSGSKARLAGVNLTFAALAVAVAVPDFADVFPAASIACTV